tara:strand:- start:248 stop:490 length:243 start_codon:yes stop_codon:yes gene_type:complete
MLSEEWSFSAVSMPANILFEDPLMLSLASFFFDEQETHSDIDFDFNKFTRIRWEVYETMMKDVRGGTITGLDSKGKTKFA